MVIVMDSFGGCYNNEISKSKCYNDGKLYVNP